MWHGTLVVPIILATRNTTGLGLSSVPFGLTTGVPSLGHSHSCMKKSRVVASGEPIGILSTGGSALHLAVVSPTGLLKGVPPHTLSPLALRGVGRSTVPTASKGTYTP